MTQEEKELPGEPTEYEEHEQMPGEPWEKDPPKHEYEPNEPDFPHGEDVPEKGIGKPFPHEWVEEEEKHVEWDGLPKHDPKDVE